MSGRRRGRRPRLPSGDDVLRSLDAAFCVVPIESLAPDPEPVPAPQPAPEPEQAPPRWRESRYVPRRARPYTLAGRVTEEELALVDAAAVVAGVPRSEFVCRVTLQAARIVLGDAVVGPCT